MSACGPAEFAASEDDVVSHALGRYVLTDLTEIFAAADGTLYEDLTYDGLDLNEAGYAVWGEALSPYVK